VTGKNKKEVAHATTTDKPTIKGENSKDKEVTSTAETDSTDTDKFPNNTKSPRSAVIIRQ
ncbi:hypothetical protein COR53_00135, partial [Staphylococcus pettenkoferi]|uniref:hypothetical protein n=1 Tax=Staphylococcus pettenkoferi TaxID=170573 RepID=UPI000FEFB383